MIREIGNWKKDIIKWKIIKEKLLWRNYYGETIKRKLLNGNYQGEIIKVKLLKGIYLASPGMSIFRCSFRSKLSNGNDTIVEFFSM